MLSYRKSLIFVIAFWIGFQLMAVLGIGIDRPPYSDEQHFCETVVSFGEEITIEKLRTYDEMSTPLQFVLYSLWGRLFGFAMWQLRMLSIIIALATYLLLHYWLYGLFKSGRVAFWTTAFVMIQPYMVGLSIFVYSDMLAILFLILTLIAVQRSNALLLTLALAGALLCRQYLAFAWLAVLFYYVLSSTNRVRMGGAVLISCLPLLALLYLWEGISPDNQFRALYLNEGIAFHPEILVLYISLIAVYLLPLLLWRRREVYTDWRVPAISLPVALLFWLFPVQASQCSLDIGVDTVGLFHRLLNHLLGDPAWSRVVFFLAFWAALPVLWLVLVDSYRRLRRRLYDTVFLLDLLTLSFMIVMPFSYLGWEKYFMPLLPILAARLILIEPRSLARRRNARGLPD